MNTSVDPCHDFYGYVCGRWLDLSLQHNWIEERKNRLLLSLPNLINKRQRKSAPSTIRMAQVLYSSCLAVEDQYKLGLQPLFDLLNKLNLPRVPAMIEPEQSSSDQGEDNFVKSMARVRKLLGIDAFFILDVKRDSRDKRKNLLRFAPPNTDTLTKVDRFYMLNVFQRIINNRTSESCDEFDIVPSENITNLVNQIRNLSLVVDELNQKYANKYSLIDQAKEIDDAKYMLLDELQQATDHYVRSVNESIVPRPLWRPLIEELLLEVVDFDPAQQKVYVGDLEYLQEIAYLLSSTEEQLLETTVWWMVVNFCVPHTSKELRDISIKRGKNLPRSTYCSNSLNDLMSMAVAWIVVEPTFARDDSRDRVAEMLDNLKRAFANFVLEDDDRLDEPAKLATLEKIRRLKSIIGFPDSLFQDGQLDKYYDGINLTTNHYFNNLLQIIRSENNKKLLNLAKYNADDDDDFSE
uniref:Peptidase M13 N-terminal domain-containing protein n=1 Tax=Trichogramma kaykai TaxID=54128 RepID=A0ABD2VXA0_9HYME